MRLCRSMAAVRARGVARSRTARRQQGARRGLAGNESKASRPEPRGGASLAARCRRRQAARQGAGKKGSRGSSEEATATGNKGCLRDSRISHWREGRGFFRRKPGIRSSNGSHGPKEIHAHEAGEDDTGCADRSPRQDGRGRASGARFVPAQRASERASNHSCDHRQGPRKERRGAHSGKARNPSATAPALDFERAA